MIRTLVVCFILTNIVCVLLWKTVDAHGFHQIHSQKLHPPLIFVSLTALFHVKQTLTLFYYYYEYCWKLYLLSKFVYDVFLYNAYMSCMYIFQLCKKLASTIPPRFKIYIFYIYIYMRAEKPFWLSTPILCSGPIGP